MKELRKTKRRTRRKGEGEWMVVKNKRSKTRKVIDLMAIDHPK